MQFPKPFSYVVFVFVIVIWAVVLLVGVALSSCSHSTVSFGDAMEALGTLFVGITVAAAILAYVTQEDSLRISKEVAYRQLITDQLKERPLFSAQVYIPQEVDQRLMNPFYKIAIKNSSSELYDVTLNGCQNEFKRSAFLNIMKENTAIEIQSEPITESNPNAPIIKELRMEYLNAIGERHECAFEVSFYYSSPPGWSDVVLKIKHSDIIKHVSKIDPAVDRFTGS